MARGSNFMKNYVLLKHTEALYIPGRKTHMKKNDKEKPHRYK